MTLQSNVSIIDKKEITREQLFIKGILIRDGTGQHFCSPARPELTRNCPAWPIYAKPQLIFWPGLYYSLP